MAEDPKVAVGKAPETEPERSETTLDQSEENGLQLTSIISFSGEVYTHGQTWMAPKPLIKAALTDSMPPIHAALQKPGPHAAETECASRPL